MSQKITPITMPKWGLSMSEGKILSWLKTAGEAVGQGDEIVEIETSKITNVYEAPAAGLLRRLVAHPDETLPVGALIAVLADATVADSALDAFVEGFRVEPDDAGTGAAVGPLQVEAGGHLLQYLALGDGPGTPVVLLHGFGGDLTNWGMNQPVLASARRVLALDLPGHGGSDRAIPEGGAEGMAPVVAAWMDVIGIDRAHLVGHSFGGSVAFALALGFPGRAASLTLIGSAGLGREINHAYLADFLAANKRREMREALGLLYADPGMVSGDLVEATLAFVRQDAVRPALQTLVDAILDGERQRLVLAPRLGELGAVKAQAIWGDADHIIPAAHAAAIPDHHILPDAGHMVQFEQAETVNRLIAAFFED